MPMTTMRCGAVGARFADGRIRRDAARASTGPAGPQCPLRIRCAVRYAVADSTPGCGEGSPAARRARVRLLVEPPALVRDVEHQCLVEHRPFDSRRCQRRRRAADAWPGRSTHRGSGDHAARVLAVDFGRRASPKGRVRALVTVERHPRRDHPLGREPVGQLVKIHRLVLQRPPQPLDEDGCLGTARARPSSTARPPREPAP